MAEDPSGRPPGESLVDRVGLLEDPVGELASAAYLLLPLVTCPQGASNGELVVADMSGGEVPDLSRGKGVIEALPLGLYTCPGSVEVGSRDSDTSGT